MAKESEEGKNGKLEQRRDAGITRMLNTPPKPHKEMKKGKAKAKGSKTGEKSKSSAR